MALQLAEQYEVYRGNVLPAMLKVLAKQLGVTVDSLQQLGIGWKIKDNAWIFPERDADGEIVGLLRRFHNGQKYCIEGSKRGLIFPVTAVIDGYSAARQQWKRVTNGDPCPVCNKPDWCGYDASDPPKFVRCMRVSEGAKHEDRGGGFIHELVPGTFKSPTKFSSPLPKSKNPVLIVEGASDVAAALGLGFVAVGRPSAQGGLGQLVRLLHGRDVAIISENDAGAGKAGAEKTFSLLRPKVSSVVKVYPPAEVKDLRDWVRQGLTRERLLCAVADGDQDSTTDILEDVAPLALAKLWLRQKHYLEGIPILRKYKGEWFRFDGQEYKVIDEAAEIRGKLYGFLEPKFFKKFSGKGELSVEKYVANRHKISDIIDAMSMVCPVEASPPCWLDDRPMPDPSNLICFQNGVLDVEEYLRGSVNLLPSSPFLFNLTSTPYDFNIDAKCPQWEKFLSEVFENDPERIALLQEWFGYNLVVDLSQEKLMLFVGRPASGKSTTLDVLQALLGKDKCVASSFKLLCSEFGLRPLLNATSAVLHDAHVPRQVDATVALETIKSIVGRDEVSVNRKFLPILPSCKLSCRFTIAVNELPELPDHARALERRLCLLYFPETFEGREDRSLKDRLPKEAPGILLWALEGLRRLRERNTFTIPVSSIPVLEEFKRFITPTAEFIYECCELEESEWVSKTQVYDAWVMWAREHGLRPGVRSRFGQRFLAQVPSCRIGRVRQGGKRWTVYIGVSLIPEAKKRYLGMTEGE